MQKNLEFGNIPMHVAINTSNIMEWSSKNNVEIEEAVSKYIMMISSLLDFQIKNHVPICSLKVLNKAVGLSDALKEFITNLSDDERIHKNRVRVFVIGGWYDLDAGLVQALKSIMEKTKDYDDNFFNICISYDGQEEIVAAIRVISRQVAAGKIELDEIDRDSVKENLASSYFPPPDLIIETSKSYSGLLLWDAKKSLIHFTEKYFLDTEEKDYMKALEFFRKNQEEKFDEN